MRCGFRRRPRRAARPKSSGGCARKLADLDLRQKLLHVLFAAELGAGRHHGSGRRSDSNPERLLERPAGRERCNQAADKTVTGANSADRLDFHRLGAEGLIRSHEQRAIFTECERDDLDASILDQLSACTQPRFVVAQ